MGKNFAHAVVLLAIFLVACAGFAAFAEPIEISASDTQAGGYNWGYLGTIAGATAAVLLIVQYTKMPLDKFLKVPTRLYVYVLALAIMLVARAVAGDMTWYDVPLVALNAVIVAVAAYGSYELTFAKSDGKST